MLQCNSNALVCYEIIPPSKIDLEMISIQKQYKEYMITMNSIVPNRLVF